MATSVSVGKRGRDQNMASAEEYGRESKRLHEWLEFQTQYLLNQSDEFNDDGEVANSDRLSEIIKSLQDEIGIPARSPPCVEFCDLQMFPRQDEDAQMISDNKGKSNSASDRYNSDLQASVARGITLMQSRATKESLRCLDRPQEAQKLQEEVERSVRSGTN